MNILNKLTTNYLKLNKKRTIVTIIGIILSGAMITAVATLAVSFQSFMLKVEISQDGAWEANIKNVKVEDIEKVTKDKRFSKTMLMVPVGIAQNPYSDDPFIYIKEYDQNALENMRVNLIEGRLPQNENEILLSQSFFDGKENEPKIGDTISLNMGKRMSDGRELIHEPKEDNETFEKETVKTYTVCGKIEKPNFETSGDYYTAGVTLLDKTKPITAKTVDIGVINKNTKNIYKDTEDIADQLGLYKQLNQEKIYSISYNNYVLAYKGVNDSSGFNEMLYSVCGTLIVVIAIGSILVIYNSFAISVSERKKQFGMLASIGATKKQIKTSVLYEGAKLGIIGIPIGILSGIGGIWVTLQIVNSLLQPMFAKQGNWSLDLVVSWPAILIAAVLIAITIYLSVMIPAKRASKISPIEAIRGNNDVKIKAKKLKAPKFIRKLFGVEGEIALKNLKRSKKRYRTTVISLVISIVLFISVTGFVDSMYSGFDSLYQSVAYDYAISIHSYEEENETKKEELKKYIEDLESIDQLAMIETINTSNTLPEEKLNDQIKKAMGENKELEMFFDKDETGGYSMNIQILSLNQKEMNRYLKEIGITKLEENQIILIDYVNMLRTAKIEANITNYKEKEKFPIEKYIVDKEKKTSTSVTKEYEIAKVTNKMPFGVSNEDYPRLIIVTSEENLKDIESSSYTQMYFTAKNEEELEKELARIEKENANLGVRVQNVKEEMEQQRNLKTIINIFLYGFIALISAIGIANIFNTISTNINLRRREFAMLKSIGMTEKGFKKMLDLECIFYGTKALLYGIPIGVFICYFINQGFGNMVQFIFGLPWSSIILSIIGVYLVVFVTMIYSSAKIKKENIIDVLRDENI